MAVCIAIIGKDVRHFDKIHLNLNKFHKFYHQFNRNFRIHRST